MAKNAIHATTDYVNSTVDDAIRPLQDRIDEIEKRSPEQSAPTEQGSPVFLFEPPADAGSESKKALEGKFFPLYHLFKDLTLGNLFIESVNGYFAKATERINEMFQRKFAETIECEKTIAFQNCKLYSTQKSIDNRYSDDMEGLKTTVNDMNSNVTKTTNSMNDTIDKLNLAVDTHPVIAKRTGLFILGKYILPVWFVILVTTILLGLSYLATSTTLHLHDENTRLRYHLEQIRQSNYRY